MPMNLFTKNKFHTITLRLVAAVACPLAFMSVSATAAQSADNGFGFQVEVTLSEKAAAKLASIDEAITVATFYYGERAKKPSKAEIQAAESDGQDPNMLEVAGDDVQLPGEGGVADMTGSTITKKDIANWGKNPVNVNVNVFSSRLHSEDNLLECGIFEDKVELAQAQTIEISCKLIGE